MRSLHDFVASELIFSGVIWLSRSIAKAASGRVHVAIQDTLPRAVRTEAMSLCRSALIFDRVLVRNVSLWNSLILGWVVIAHQFMPTRHNYWMIEHNHVPANRLESIKPCCRYITRALILLACCLCSIEFSDEVENLCASISSLLIISVAYIISLIALSCGLAEKE
jgi:hypothetical protein